MDQTHLRRLASSAANNFATRSETRLTALTGSGADRGTQVALAVTYRQTYDPVHPLPAFPRGCPKSRAVFAWSQYGRAHRERWWRELKDKLWVR